MNTINEMRKAIDDFSKVLKEAYIYDEEDNEMPQQEYERAPMEDEPMEDEGMMDSETDDILNQIRMLSLKGIQKFAEDVDNEFYVTYKKIWMMCDKCLSEKDKVEN